MKMKSVLAIVTGVLLASVIYATNITNTVFYGYINANNITMTNLASINANPSGDFYITVGDTRSLILGGYGNSADGSYHLLMGGDGNMTTESKNAAIGGRYNVVGGYQNVIIGGESDTTSTGTNSIILGGINNSLSGSSSIASGGNAHSSFDYTFVWSDNTSTSATTNKQFLVQAANGVGINTTSTSTNALTVGGYTALGGLNMSGPVTYPVTTVNNAATTFNIDFNNPIQTLNVTNAQIWLNTTNRNFNGARTVELYLKPSVLATNRAITFNANWHKFTGATTNWCASNKWALVKVTLTSTGSGAESDVAVVWQPEVQ